MMDGIVLPDDSDHEILENDIEEFELDLQRTLNVSSQIFIVLYFIKIFLDEVISSIIKVEVSVIS